MKCTKAAKNKKGERVRFALDAVCLVGANGVEPLTYAL